MEDVITIFVDAGTLTEEELNEENLCPEEYRDEEWWLIGHENKGI